MSIANPSSSGNGKGRLNEEAKKPSHLGYAEIMKKCLEENKGDKTKCQSQIEAFKSAASSPPTLKPPPSRILRRGSLTDVDLLHLKYEWGDNVPDPCNNVSDPYPVVQPPRRGNLCFKQNNNVVALSARMNLHLIENVAVNGHSCFVDLIGTIPLVFQVLPCLLREATWWDARHW
ncbi:hypothetical protein Cgig2_026318 [Carnegiea gigantea]|uniref:Uncharacterized protein n=1 Tax=Carnegiea gigantea TaxID=171969 RepID=A0A9Q1KDZ7_9CARY|nr:hypothetical protein Cgig2_026318 [Carnegiea gigantea]